MREEKVSNLNLIADRNLIWASSNGQKSTSSKYLLAHRDENELAGIGFGIRRLKRTDKEFKEKLILSKAATFAEGAGNRRYSEIPDEERTCFEKDRDRILHSTAFRRLAGKTQVFIFPKDHQRTRLTHALEVSQVALSISNALGFNSDLCEAIAIGHDCGHGPGGHASEDALSIFLEEGFDHAPFGALKTLSPLNLCVETLDGIANHSWSRPSPYTPEGRVVSWADRIAYVCHDFEDAHLSGIVKVADLPKEVSKFAGKTKTQQLDTFIRSIIESTYTTGQITMDLDTAEILNIFRAFNYEHIYMRKESIEQNNAVIRLLRSLVEYFEKHPDKCGYFHKEDEHISLEDDPLSNAVSFVAGMTDRFACNIAREVLNWTEHDLPRRAI
ncbi:MAG: HD domain-containing protein [Acidimicrobiales bacterium]|nr:HD domain-containing protein [Acidimicrobiales bacterium]